LKTYITLNVKDLAQSLHGRHSAVAPDVALRIPLGGARLAPFADITVENL